MKIGHFILLKATLIVAMICIVASAPVAAPLNNNNGASNSSTVQCCHKNSDHPSAEAIAACHASSSKPATSKAAPAKKSVLDAEALESPFSFFKDYNPSSGDRDESDILPQASAIIITVKTLVAALLSTII
ncbi:hypothetical protein [Pontibacter sp. SGAir0037]|uniref:hypothetical protein n=1 Tax=Pontibacter sp. SGAir0037 TaxID=2571030 RepID=UPI0010CCD6F2|nr:hypothetical protein [Pontibacter sp. SGAir0037]QCR23932.1 hypothetical protein C1N53_17300 [Pontibacter sp. SGAir0037]